MPLENWSPKTYTGYPLFVSDVDAMQIVCKQDIDKGSWIAHWAGEFDEDQEFLVTGNWSFGSVLAVFFVDTLFIAAETLKPGKRFALPPGTNHMRIDCRLWNKVGTATFSNIHIHGIVEQEDFLPVPPPDTTQKHDVTGWKWGTNFMLVTHHQGGEDQPIPPDYGAPYEVTGFQHGRQLDLQIGNMFIDQEEEE